jgi:hypothetical protein
MNKIIFLIASLAVIPAELPAATTNPYSDADRGLFLLPRSSAMGTSDFVFSRDGTSQSNPANLPFDSLREVSLSYAGFYQNTFSTSVLSYVTRIGRFSGVGFSIGYLYNPDIPNTEQLLTIDDVPIYDSTRISTFSESQIYFHAGYGVSHSLGSGITLAAGAGINAQRYSLSPYRGYGIGCDGGAALDFTAIGLKTAVTCENLTTDYMRWSKGYSERGLPHVRFGMGWRKEIPYLYGRVQVQFKSLDLLANEGVNADSTVDSAGARIVHPTTKHFSKEPLYFFYSGTYGLEYTVMNVLSLRLGIPIGDSYGGDLSRICFGCGVNLLRKKLSLDFSYLTHELAGTYQLGVSYRWRDECNKK